MANVFSKEERVAFDQIGLAFEDACELSSHVTKFGTAAQNMERSNDEIWIPQPYMLTSDDRVVGTDVTFKDVKQLSVPATIDNQKVVAFKLNALELREKLREGSLGKEAYEQLATDVNLSIRDCVSMQGTIVSAISSAAGTFDNVATCQTLMNELGIGKSDRKIAFNTRDYNGLAGNLASRTLMPKSQAAYETISLGQVARFDAFDIDIGKPLAANSASITIATNGAQVRYVPKSSESTTQRKINVDNRYQTVTVSSTSGVTAGDAFTIAGIKACNHKTKESTGQLKTFRVIEVVDGTSMVISPPMIGANSSPTDAELAYKNVIVESTSATAAITFLNVASCNINPFWYKDSIKLIPSTYAVPDDQGPRVMRATTKQGLEIIMTKSFTGKSFVSEYTFDCRWGTVNANPEMNGILIFGQS